MTQVDATTDLLDRVAALLPDVRARATEAEALRAMPGDLAEQFKHAGIFRLALPAALGGWGADPFTIFEVVERLAHADGSAGWTAMIGSSTVQLLAWLDSDVATAMLAGDPDISASAVFAPTGTAVPAADNRGYRVDGRWTFSSGCAHSEWFLGGVLTEGPTPGWRFAWMPAAERRIVETWNGAGLRATGSHDVVAESVTVPAERVCAPMFEPARHPDPLYRLSFYNMLSPFLAGFSCGVGRRALDEFADYADRKRRGPASTSVADDDIVQHRFAEADAAWRAARAFYLEAIGDAWQTVTDGDECTLRQRATVMQAAQVTQHASVAAVDALLPLAGASAADADNPIQRCFRDIHTASHHLIFNVDVMKQIGQVRLGRVPEAPRF